MEENNDNNQNNENVENVENVENNNIPSEELTIVEENSTEEEVETVNNIKIANDAVAMYVGIAIAEIPGVYGMSGALAGITEAISGKRNYTKGVKVDVNEKTVKIDVNIIVEYGSRIPDVAYEIQNRVKKSVENMTGLKVDEVNVHVQGVNTES